MFSFAVDLHRNILSAQCCIRYQTSDVVDKMRVIVKSNCLSILLYSDLVLCQQVNIFTPHNFFIPATFSCSEKNSCISFVDDTGCQVESEYEIKQNGTSKQNFIEAAFRLQLSNEDLIERTILKPLDETNGSNFLKSKIKAKTPYQIICTTCHETLNKQLLLFESVEDFKDGFSELAETWFCHNHSSNQSQMKTNICYISELCFHLHQSVIDSMALSVTDKVYKCGNCCSVLSDSKKYLFTGFFSDKIMLKTQNDNSCNIASYKDEIALRSFLELIENNLKCCVSLKLFLQSKIATGETTLLLWITSQKVAQYLFQTAAKDILKELQMKTKEVYKVLYCSTPLNPEVEKLWKHDCSVDFFAISDNMMSIIVKLLGDSSEYLLSSERDCNGFKLGYLPLCIS